MNPHEENDVDDTVEISLTDKLLLRAEPDSNHSTGVPEADQVGLADDEEYLEIDHKRSRWTTGLAIALIFVVGIFCGVLLTRALSPTPAPQTVYLLNDGQDSGSSAYPPPPGPRSPSSR